MHVSHTIFSKFPAKPFDTALPLDSVIFVETYLLCQGVLGHGPKQAWE